MKNHEDFRASVYARAQREQARITARRKKVRSASLSALMVIIVAAVAIPIVRNTSDGIDPKTIVVPQTLQSKANKAGLSSRMVLLVGTPTGDTEAVVLDDQDQQRQFVNQYRAALNMNEAEGLPMTPASDTAKTIHSTDELSAFLSGLPDAAELATADFDDVFFSGNNLCAMPMELPAQPEVCPEPTTEIETTSIAAQETIPDNDFTQPPMMSITVPESNTAVATILAQNSAASNAPAANSAVKVLLLVPVNKGE